MTVMIITKEYEELLSQFEKDHKGMGRTDKEAKELWSRGNIYQDGRFNELFRAYQKGYACGKCVERLDLYPFVPTPRQ